MADITFPWLTFQDAALIGYPKDSARRIDECRSLLEVNTMLLFPEMRPRLNALYKQRQEYAEAEMFWKTYMVRGDKCPR